VNAVFNVTLSHAASAPVTVNYATMNLVARSGIDYFATSGTLTFASGQTEGAVTVRVIGENTKENNETFRLRLSGATNATIADLEGIGTIIDDDTTPTMTMMSMPTSEGSNPAAAKTVSGSSTTTSGSSLLSTQSFSLTEPLDSPTDPLTDPLDAPAAPLLESEMRRVVFTVMLTNPSEIPISVAYETVNGSAIAGLDYTPVLGLLAFGEDETVKTIEVLVSPDMLHELNEAFTLKFSNPIEVIVPTDTVTGQIDDDDAAPTVGVSDVSVTEGHDGLTKAVFTVTMASASGKPEMVKYTTVDGTAVAGSDYEATSGYLIFEPGVSELTVSVGIVGDKEIEKAETFQLLLAAASDAPVAKLAGAATIIDDDAAPGSGWMTSDVREFQAGTIGKGSYLANTSGGEIMLAPLAADEFVGTALSSWWAVQGLLGSVTVANGAAVLDNREMTYKATYSSGRSLDFAATFSGDSDQFVGLSSLMFVMDNQGRLFAQTVSPSPNAVIRTLIPGSWAGKPHQFRITWNSKNVVYTIDGAMVATHSVSFAKSVKMAPVAADRALGNGKLVIDWVRLGGYTALGTYTSAVHDAGAAISSATAAWLANVPQGTTMRIEISSGNTPQPDSSWSAFAAMPGSGIPIAVSGRYLQFRAVMTTSLGAVTPVLNEVVVTYAP
jgi:hypothetical protein